MSGTATIEVPKGLDKLSVEEQRLMDSMRADEAAPSDALDAGVRKTIARAPGKAVAPEPEPEAEIPEIEVDEQTAADAGQPQPQKMVPHQALHAERVARKAAEERAVTVEREKAADMARLQERINLITGIAQVATAPAAAPVAEVQIPDVNTDPVGHFQAVASQLKRQVEDQAAILQGFTQGAQQNRQIADLRNWGAAQEQVFEAKEPSYRAAMDHLAVSRRAELEAIGVMDLGEQQRIIATDITNIAARARQENANFAERLYALATKRGFQKPAIAGAIPPLDAEPADATERRTAARDNATTISSVNGAGPGPRLSVEKIANMNDSQFTALYNKLKDDPQALRDLMGH